MMKSSGNSFKGFSRRTKIPVQEIGILLDLVIYIEFFHC